MKDSNGGKTDPIGSLIGLILLDFFVLALFVVKENYIVSGRFSDDQIAVDPAGSLDLQVTNQTTGEEISPCQVFFDNLLLGLLNLGSEPPFFARVLVAYADSLGLTRQGNTLVFAGLEIPAQEIGWIKIPFKVIAPGDLSGPITVNCFDWWDYRDYKTIPLELQIVP